MGTGPAGCYTAKYLQAALDKHGYSHHIIDLIERQATIGGLVRYGVAPDHPEVKHAIHDFEAALMPTPAVVDGGGGDSSSDGSSSDKEQVKQHHHHHRVRLYGNVSLGKDVQLDELRQLYDLVVLTYGCESSQLTGLPGEDALEGVLSAREFVAWYNGAYGFVAGWFGYYSSEDRDPLTFPSNPPTLFRALQVILTFVTLAIRCPGHCSAVRPTTGAPPHLRRRRRRHRPSAKRRWW